MNGKNNAKSEDAVITIIAAITGNILIGVIKFIAAALTGSSAMISEGIHSIIDSANGILVAIGIKASRKNPTLEHQFGYGKNLYFYSFIVALLIFALGGGISVYKGINSIIQGTTLGDPTISYIVCILSIIIESTSFFIAFKTAKKLKGRQSIIKYIRNSKDPSAWTVLFEDSAAVLGLFCALLGIFLSHVTNNPIYDSCASIAIGLILFTVAILLMKETKSLLIGEGLSANEIQEIIKIVESDKDVRKCGNILSLYMGPNDLILNLDVCFLEETIEKNTISAIDRIEKDIKEKFPEATKIFIETENLYVAKREQDYQQLLIKQEKEKLKGDDINEYY